VKKKKKAKGKMLITISRELMPEERAKQIIKDKSDSSHPTDQEFRELVFLLAKTLE
jgi:hypothetical protein